MKLFTEYLIRDSIELGKTMIDLANRNDQKDLHGRIRRRDRILQEECLTLFAEKKRVTKKGISKNKKQHMKTS